ncbi:MAG: hypothetical protein RMK29_00825 [Myxococcales bacterium]|nr:hypothetical protein [Myxococcota bacterium]MDW8280221.1 hypothetical protein [Myxococcales bacterium]
MLHAHSLAAAADAAAVGVSPPGGASGCGARSSFRIRVDVAGLRTLQRCAGIALCLLAWIAMLAGFAHLWVAAVHNHRGELGLGIDATIQGARTCVLSLLLAAVGVPLWVVAEGHLRRQRRAALAEGAAALDG